MSQAYGVRRLALHQLAGTTPSGNAKPGRGATYPAQGNALGEASAEPPHRHAHPEANERQAPEGRNNRCDQPVRAPLSVHVAGVAHVVAASWVHGAVGGGAQAVPG